MLEYFGAVFLLKSVVLISALPLLSSHSNMLKGSVRFVKLTIQTALWSISFSSIGYQRYYHTSM